MPTRIGQLLKENVGADLFIGFVGGESGLCNGVALSCPEYSIPSSFPDADFLLETLTTGRRLTAVFGGHPTYFSDDLLTHLPT
jgi:hypothetical protein